MVRKKESNNKTCLAAGCNTKLIIGKVRVGDHQYCQECNSLKKRLKQLRQPCRIIGCKNPADVDGYCNGCRPEAANVVTFRLDWLKGENLIDSNVITCVYCDATASKNMPHCSWHGDIIREIHAALNPRK